MTFLVVYCVLAFISYVCFYAITDKEVNDRNKAFGYPIYKVVPLKILLMASLFPFYWIAAIIHGIVYMKN